MKRHPSIIPLSHEHHQSLILAQLLKSSVRDYAGMPNTPDEKAAYAFNCYEQHIRAHFETEEKMLHYLSHYVELKPLTAEIISEHRELTERFLSLKNVPATEDFLNSLGHALYDHIRKEDRVLFPLIESLCTEAEFQYISALHENGR